MRGLTQIEYECLREALNVPDLDSPDVTDSENLVYDRLTKRGLVSYYPHPLDPDTYVIWHITPLGRLALRIHASMTMGILQ